MPYTPKEYSRCAVSCEEEIRNHHYLVLGLTNQFHWDADACNMTDWEMTAASEKGHLPQNKAHYMFLNLSIPLNMSKSLSF